LINKRYNKKKKHYLKGNKFLFIKIKKDNNLVNNQIEIHKTKKIINFKIKYNIKLINFNKI
jgi:hypothetical protein